MKRKLIATIAILCLLLCFGWIYNRFFAYVWHYNLGNMHYRNYSYVSATEQYEKALEKNIPEEKECRIRINLALIMAESLGGDYAQPHQVEDSIAVLEGARDQLLADHCATEEGTGHSETAEQLKEEIEKILEELYDKRESSEGENPEDGSSEGQQSEEMDAKEQGIREEIRQMQEKAYQDRESDRQFMKEYDYEVIFGYDGDIW